MKWSVRCTVLLFCASLTCIEGETLRPGERITEPQDGRIASKLEERYKATEEDVKKAEERVKENKEALKEPDLPESKQAELTEAIVKDEKLVKTYKQAGNVLDKPEVKKRIEQYKEQLAKNVQRGGADINLFSNELAKAFNTGNVASVDAVLESFRTSGERVLLKKRLAQERDPNKKMDIIDKVRESIKEVRKLVEGELAKKGKTIDKDYKNVLEQFNEVVEKKLAVVDEQALAVEEQRLDLFTRLAKRFGRWFDKYFGKAKEKPVKKPDEKPGEESGEMPVEKSDEEIERGSIEEELNTIEANKKNITPIAQLFEEVDQFAEEIDKFIKLLDAELSQKPITEEQYEQLEKNVIGEGLGAINSFEKVFSPEQQEKIDMVYEKLQILVGDLLVKAKRYKGDFSTLYQSELEAYTNELDPERLGFKKEEGGAFGPDEAYEALGLTKEILGFEPQLEPGKIAEEQIEKAYEKKRKTLKEGTYEWRAARNASVILRNPPDKENYDAFLNDWRELKKENFDPNNPDKTAQDWLNTQGKLHELEISKSVHDQIYREALPTLMDEMVDVGMKKSQDGQSPLSKKLEDTRQRLEDALVRAKKRVQKQKPVAPSGPPD